MLHNWMVLGWEALEKLALAALDEGNIEIADVSFISLYLLECFLNQLTYSNA